MTLTTSTGIVRTGTAVTAADRDRAGLASPWEMALRQFRHWLVNYRRTWRGSAYSSFLNPVLYLGSIGLGLGTLVNKHGTAQLGGVSYLAFLAPGLLAATGMQTAIVLHPPRFGGLRVRTKPLRWRTLARGFLGAYIIWQGNRQWRGTTGQR